MNARKTSMVVQVNGQIGSNLCLQAEDLVVSSASVIGFAANEKVLPEALCCLRFLCSMFLTLSVQQ